MKQIMTILKYEFLRYFNTPVAFVYLIAFLLLNGFCVFYFGNFLERGIADLNPMFVFMPWILLFFVPAISMRLWAEEFKSGTIYQTLSLPISITSITIGKFLAAWAFCSLSIAATFELWITINAIATPDNSIITYSYLSTFLLCAALISIALYASSTTKNQVIALILGILFILFFYVSSLDFIVNLYQPFLSNQTLEILASFNILSNYYSMISGLIELKAILFFSSIIVFFIFITITTINNKFSAKKNTPYIIIFSLLLFIGFNLISSKSISYFDASSQKKHSLSESTKYILQNLKEPVTIKVYYSKILSTQSPQFKESFNSVITLLKQYKKLAKNKLNIEIYYPQTLSELEDIAIASGLKGLPILDSNQNAFFGLVFTDAINNKEEIELLTPSMQNKLETIITQKIYLLNHTKPSLGVISGVEMFETEIAGVATQNWQIIDEISNFYDIKKIDNNNPDIKDIDALMIISPQDMSKELIENIKSYKNQGGKFLILLDPAPEAIRNFAPQTKAIKASDFKELENEFGFKFIDKAFVADFDNSITVDATIDYTQNPIITQDIAQIKLTEDNIEQAYLPTAGLQTIILSTSSIIAANKEANITFTPLLAASKNSSLMSIEYIYNNYNPAIILSNFKKDNYKKILAAKITSNNKKNPYKAIVIADSDLLYDSYINNSDNLYLILNSLDELVKNHSLLSLRSKNQKASRLELIEDIRRKAQLKYAKEENLLLSKVNNTKTQLQKVISKRDFEGRKNFIADELALIAKLRQNLSDLKNNLGKLKEASYQKLKNIELLIKAINIYLLPLIILIITLLIHNKKTITKEKAQIVFDKKSKVLSIIALIALITGIAINISTQKKQTDLPVFKNLNIQEINKIIITKEEKSIELYKSDNNWQIKNHDGFKVYDERIKNLLTAISFAKFYEQKSNQVKNLPYFGLGNKEATHIELFDNNNIKQDFYIGEYDIDLGRGARGAYYRDANNYDVWLINADLIDVSPNWREFAYSFAWNLRYGKAINMDIELIKAMINTPLLRATNAIKDAIKDFAIDVKTDKKEFDIEFYQSDNKHFIKYSFENMYYEISKEDFEEIKKNIEETSNKSNAQDIEK